MATRKGPPPGDEGSSGRTQRLPRMLVEPSSLDVSIAVEDGVFAVGDDATQPTMSRPQLIVMEEKPVGLADALARLGFLVRPAATGVEAMSLVAERLPNAVITGPGDTERRRVLVGALRLRFPGVPVVIVLPVSPAKKAIDDAAADVAKKDGAHAVLPWPLPSAGEVYAAIPGSPRVNVNRSSGSAPKTVVAPASAALPALASSVEDSPLLSADFSAEQSAAFALPGPASSTGSMPQSRPLIHKPIATELSQKPTTLPPQFMTPLPLPPPPSAPQKQKPPASSPPPEATQTLLAPRIDVAAEKSNAPIKAPRGGIPAGVERRPRTATGDDLATLNVPRLNIPMTREGDENVETSPGKPAANVQAALEPRGDIKDVLLAVAPFVWGLDDCARYLDDLHAHHVAGADVHARTVRLVANLLAQLQARVDELK